ncbi:MAG TPA: glutamine-hydrolyzing GMP synthase [Thermotogota bacterium]|nr:glutamine-hydrolyzing GMP synthase [Thermotogota bacterium]
MEKIWIIDYGSQYTRLIARRVRENHVLSEVSTPASSPDLSEVRGIILSGGPASISDEGAPVLPDWFANALDRGIPVLGICYGFHLLTRLFGGEVRHVGQGEYGRTRLTIQQPDVLLSDIPAQLSVWMSHGDSLSKRPEHFQVVATSQSGIVGAMRHDTLPLWGIQFHPEVRHTEFGEQVLANFLFDICHCKASWNLEDFAEREVERIRQRIGDQRVISAFSGGVDSSVASVLVHRAVGKNLVNIFVDHGLLRKNEEKEVPRLFQDALGLHFRVANVQQRFFEALQDVEDPEEKRKIIGEQFIRVFEEQARELGGAPFLVQGTIYSDVIESAHSGGENTARIKSHHNVGGLPEHMDMQLVEPLRFLFKDEVRRLGELLGIPEHVTRRHPFPGPGLAVRCPGKIDPEKIRILKEADFLFREVLRESEWEARVWQAFAVLLPVRSVGVAGDRRSYGYTVALRAVDSVEAMTADWSRIPHDVLDEAARRITNCIPEVGRVVYDITSKPPATIEWE